MEEKDIGSPKAGTLGAWMVMVGSMVGLFGEMATHLPTHFVRWGSTLVILIGSLLL